MSELNRDMSLSEQFSAVMKRIGDNKPPHNVRQAEYLGLIAIALGSIADDLTVLADKEGKDVNDKR